MKIGLVMEGGAMRGLYTAGVTDVLMENGIEFAGAVGVSAGAAFGCNYKSSQIGRARRYNVEYCRDKRYKSISSLLKTGDLYNTDFAYRELPLVLDPFDREAFAASPMEFYVVATDANTGKPYYRKLSDGGVSDLLWIRASASMPVFSRLVEIDGALYSDGGTADAIPLKFFEDIGYEANVVILTQPTEYIKKKNRFMGVIRAALKGYPALVSAIENRHIFYNEEREYVFSREREGQAFVFSPPCSLKVSPAERDAKKLEEVYQIGRKDAESRLLELKAFLLEKGGQS